MPAAIRRSDMLATVQLLRQVALYAADSETRREATRLADMWQAQADPNSLILTD